MLLSSLLQCLLVERKILPQNQNAFFVFWVVRFWKVGILDLESALILIYRNEDWVENSKEIRSLCRVVGIQMSDAKTTRA